ncbi:hypothetical protein VA596_01820 [Amycolatopsis sp., V23-08]|uniref:Transcriptional regulator n=1 Tax=Amycolatopsis heterodermiae TaxID=3110235 RepID=A0ABU5QXC7_9PSEU|nr:hypothetical protein [Amycolatopsis sp., V23-08]MEA5358259.1 hypothetical protein [Amycolatopsis sp., V23-08]
MTVPALFRRTRVFVAALRCARGLLASGALLGLVAGLPWALVHFVGWPLPDQLPTWAEIQATLLNPMSVRLLLNTLAVVCWIVWFFFVLDVLRCSVDAARGMTWPSRRPGPLRGVAAVLVGTIVLTLLGSRSSYSAPLAGTAAPTVGLRPVAVVASLPPGPAPQATGAVIETAAPAPAGMVQVTEEVRLPRDGVYDSMWRVAERLYGPGGGSRWPELFQLNRGVEQPDGRALTNPNLVRPGWKITAYIPAPNHEHPSVPPRQPSPPTTTAPTQPAPEPTAAGEHREDRPEPAVDLVTGVFVSLGLAGAIAAAVVSTRMWRRRRYRIGSGDRADLERPIAPVVRALCAAHDDGDLQPVEVAELVDLASPGESEFSGELAQVPAKIGVRERRELALSLARTCGLGLAGAGATAAARALLLHLLAEQQLGNGVGVIVPVDDLCLVFDGIAGEDLPRSVHVVATLDAALDEMEAALLTRTRRAIEEIGARPALPSLVLLARPASHADRRLQAVLDNGSTLGMAGVLLGQWRPGATLLVRQDGTVSATSPGIDDVLTGTRLFNVPAADATSLLEVLRAAESAAERAREPVPERRSTEVEASSSLEQEEQHAEDNQPAARGEPPVGTEQPRLFLRVLGRVQLAVRDEAGDRELGGAFTPKQREVLVFLALHPQGVRREVLNEAVWPDSRPPRPYNSFHNTLSTLRRALADATDGQTGNLVLNEDGRYRLSDELLDVDFWQLQRVLQASRPPDEHGNVSLRDAVELYRSDLAEDLLAQWIEPFRESVRRDVLDALGALIRVDGDISPETALILLERARKFDQYNEGVYRDIIRMQARLGQYAAIPRTVALLSTMLAEIDQQVSTETLNLADFLQRRGGARRKDAAGSAAAS